MSVSFHIAPDRVMDDIAKLSSAVLFGSRSMASRPAKEGFDPAVMIGAQINDSTDWDFSAPYTQENHDILINAGYIHWPAEQLGYRDELTEGVYIKTYPHKFDLSNPVVYSGVPTANVVLRNDYPLFCQTWNSIDLEFYYKHLWKRSPNYDGQDLSFTKETIRDIMDQLFRTARYMV
jgi:hypothetical protein